MHSLSMFSKSTRNTGVIVVNTDRHNGISPFPYNSLNLSYGVGDDPASVSENRQRLKKSLSLQSLVSAVQVHGDRIYRVAARVDGDLEVDGYDALITDMPGIGLMIQQADCQGITLHDPVRQVIGAVHCGWKGSVCQIIEKTVREMTLHYKSRPENLIATISPSLGPCCAEFINYKTELPASFLAFQEQENYFNFWQISKMQLEQAGVAAANIAVANCCTSCSSDYFSYRRACRQRDGKTGRCVTVIALVEYPR